jgi:hypothetical protein
MHLQGQVYSNQIGFREMNKSFYLGGRDNLEDYLTTDEVKLIFEINLEIVYGYRW